VTVAPFGHGALLLAVAASVLSAVAAGTGRAGVARWSLRAAAATLALAVVALARAIVHLDYSLSYVADVASRSLSGPYRLAGLWAGMEGSLLLWAAVVAVVAIASPTARGASAPRDRTIATAALAVLVGALAAASRFTADPFRTLSVPAIDGAGVTPILEHPAMLVHPPLLYAGLATTAPLFAITVAAAWRNELDDGWREAARRLALIAWTTLTVAMTIGAAWAYAELGWGGFWAWDPIENGVLLPWLVLVVVVHALRRSKGSARRAGRVDAALAAAAFLAALTGAALTRSGAAASVHAFAQTAGVGRALSAIGAASLVTAVIALARVRRPPADDPEHVVDPLDRLLLAQHVVLLVIIAIVAIGTIGPVVQTWFGGRKRAISGHYFAALTAPAAVALVVLLLASRPWQRERSAASRVAHLGLVVLLVGFAAGAWSSDATALLAPGGSTSIAGHRVVVGTVEVLTTARYQRLVVPVQLWIDGDVVTLRPELDIYETRGVALAETVTRVGWRRDVQFAVRQVTPEGDVRLEAHDRPGVLLVWLGAALLAAGGLLGLSRGRRRSDAARASRAEITPRTEATGPTHEASGPISTGQT
jgi:cytochrome c-type biogenesis protein CcmF